MPKVRLLVSVSGIDFSWVPGEVVEMSAAEAAKWADGVRGELVRGDKPERAIRSVPERAAQKGGPGA